MVKDTTQSHADYVKSLHMEDSIRAQKLVEERIKQKDRTADDILAERDDKAKRDAELQARKFTLPEIEELRRDLPAADFQKLVPYIEESNRRGEWKDPLRGQMTRAEFQKYNEDRGRPGPVFSMYEHTELGKDAGLPRTKRESWGAVVEVERVYDSAQEHLKAAFRDGRVLHGPNGQAIPFADEVSLTPEQRQARLQPRIKEMRSYHRAKNEVGKITKGLEGLEQQLKHPGGVDKNITLATLTGYLGGAVQTLQACHKSAEFPLENIPGYQRLVAERDEGQAECKRLGVNDRGSTDQHNAIHTKLTGDE